MIAPPQTNTPARAASLIWPTRGLPSIPFFVPCNGTTSVFRTIRLKLGQRAFARFQRLIGKARRDKTAVVVFDAGGHIWGFMPDGEVHAVQAPDAPDDRQIIQFDVRVL